ncbi:thiamine diphosphokinase [Kiritimatiellaeota bacterium B1221]|nr:thiamine diphosphokinase [Kiritimatiellaeota bacterium B1221]
MKAVLVLNGEPPDLQRLQSLAKSLPVYAADGGAQVCMAAGVQPEIVVGDFDSQSLTDLPPEWTHTVIPDQNSTDFQKLLSVLPDAVDEIRILGGLGKRLDHMLTNLMIASDIDGKMKLVFESQEEVLYRITPDHPFERELAPGSTVSLLPFERVEAVESEGLKWNLEGRDMGVGIQLGQSNCVESPKVKISIKAGALYVWFALGDRVC